MENIRIVEYEPAYAGSIADMWNRSRESWGGNDTVRTEENVLREHENAVHLNVFLAVAGDEVLGYCSFDKYTGNEGALYVALLNVRPDYHGKKIGKALVLKAVERTIELGWPRLDLYTWPGNTKAVPTYKKCGFFWEKRDDRTHLMNFIPTVLQTEALKDYFHILNWYDDSKRAIKVEPDGRKENGFDYYEYSWEKDDTHLRVEFEKTGRGMRLIETDDYLISAAVEDSDLIFGRNYNIVYYIVNKTGKALNVSIKGLGDKNVKYSFERSVDVVDNTVLKGSFTVEEIAEEQNTMHTHPGVVSEVLINGKKALLKVGIRPRFPAKITLTVPYAEYIIGAEAVCYLDMENNFKEEAVFELELPDTDSIKFSKGKQYVELKGKDRVSIEVPYTLKAFGHFNASVLVSVRLKNNEQITFTKKISALFKGRTGMFGGEEDNCYFACNGNYGVYIWKPGNWSEMSHNRIHDSHKTTFISPQLGRPYSSEFSKEKPTNVEYRKEGQIMIMEALYRSGDFKGIELLSIFRIYPDGLLEHHYEIYNAGEQKTIEDVWFNEGLVNSLFRAILPYEGKFVEIEDNYADDLACWDSDKLTENWIFSKGDKLTRGVCWNKGSKIKFGSWMMYIEHNLGKIAPKERITLKPLYVALGNYQHWHDFRAFALQASEKDSPGRVDSFHLTSNNGNPFAGDSCKVIVKDYKQKYFNGKLSLSSMKQTFRRMDKQFEAEEGVREADYTVEIPESTGIDIFDLRVDFDALEFNKRLAVFKVKGKGISSQITEEKGLKVFSANNGMLEIKASPEYTNGLYSLTYKGCEWLDSSFPNPGPRSWWNPWSGGIQSKPGEMMPISILQEKRQAEFVNIKDSCSNVWSGIKLNLKVEKYERLKGLEYNQYFLMLPGTPVMCHVVEIIQNTGFFFNYTYFPTEMFFMTDTNIKEMWFTAENRSGEIVKYKAGRVTHEIETGASLMFGSDSRKDVLQLFTNPDALPQNGFANVAAAAAFIPGSIQAKNGKRVFTPPMFLIFNDERIPDEYLRDLKNIKFE